MSYDHFYNSIKTNAYDDDLNGTYLIDRKTNKAILSETWQPYDIEAFKFLYGLRPNYNSEDNTYFFTEVAALELIHDLGGYDTIDLTGSKADNDIKNMQINLGGGAFYQAGKTTMKWSGDESVTGHVYTTSFDTEIEKFIGSDGKDHVALGPTSDTIITNGGDDLILFAGFYKSIKSIKIDSGAGNDTVQAIIANINDVSSLLDINGGSGYDRLQIFTDEENIDLSLYIRHFDNFEFYIFESASPQIITIDSADFIETSSLLLTIGGGSEDTVILPDGAILDDSSDEYFNYYSLNDITIALEVDLMIV